MTKYKDISKKDDQSLAELITEKREALRKQRFAASGSALRSMKEVRADRKDIARALTALNERHSEPVTEIKDQK